MKSKLPTILRKVVFSSLLIIFSAFIFGALAFIFYLPSHLNEIKEKVSLLISKKISYEVEIGELGAQWNGINPSLSLHDITVFNKNKEKSISTKKIVVDISWLSLIKLRPVIDQIILVEPNVLLVKEMDGSFSINGITSEQKSEDDEFSNWALNLDDLVIQNGSLGWIDKTINPSDKILFTNINFHYGSSKALAFLGRRTFDITSDVPAFSEKPIKVNGFFNLTNFSNIDDIDGGASIYFQEYSLEFLQPWLKNIPDIEQGEASVDLSIEFEAGEIKTVEGSLEIEDLRTMTPAKQPINFDNLQGKVAFSHDKGFFSLGVSELSLKQDAELKINKASLSAVMSDEMEIQSLFINSDRLKLDDINKAAEYLSGPFSETKTAIAQLALKGQLKDIKLTWNNSNEFLQGLELKLKALNVSSNEFSLMPGLENLTANIELNKGKGFVDSVSKNLIVRKSSIFREALQFNEFTGKIAWDQGAYKLTNIVTKNNDFESIVNGKYELNSNGGYANLNVVIPFANIAQLKPYYPKNIGKEGLSWLDTSLLAGQAKDINIVLKGNLDEFPYVNETNKPDYTKGIFKVSSNFFGAKIEYGTNWPELLKFDFGLNVDNNHVEFVSDKGEIQSNPIKSFYGSIDAYNINNPVIKINTVLDSPIQKILTLVNNSPIKKATGGLTDKMTGDGPGELSFQVHVPMNDLEHIVFKGHYDFLGSTIENKDLDLPRLDNIKARIDFDNENAKIEKGSASLYGQDFWLSMSNLNGITIFKLAGNVDTTNLKVVSKEFSDRIQGQAKWEGEIKLLKGGMNLSLHADLKNISINKLGPFNKSISQPMALNVDKTMLASREDLITFSIKNLANARIIQNENNSIKNGFIAINSATDVMPAEGIKLYGDFDNIDLDDFSVFFEAGKESQQSTSPFISSADLTFKSLSIPNATNFHDVKLGWRSQQKGFDLKVSAKETEGSVRWDADENRYKVMLSRLQVSGDGIENKHKEKDPGYLEEGIPPLLTTKIEMQIDSLFIDDIKYGAIQLKASETRDGWNFDSFKIKKASNTIQGKGRWDFKNKPSTSYATFEWELNDIEKTLNEMNFNNLVSKGYARLAGELQWEGDPLDFDDEQLIGSFSLYAKDGAVLEIDRGVSGRLMGLLSLQNLPQRLTLDFSDLFEKGMPFTEIESKNIQINKGRLSSTAFIIQGPSADVNLSGEVHFIKETQNLHVFIKPKISDTLTLGALAGGPLVAAAAFIAQKILDDPLNKITSSEYLITGSWNDPEEKKINSNYESMVDGVIIQPASDLFNTIAKPTESVLKSIIVDPLNKIFGQEKNNE
jgi:uncharacterized protein (TIGR02099 family)